MTRREYKRRVAELYAPYETAKSAWRRNPSPATQWAAAAAFEVWNETQSAMFADYWRRG
jgi:hypothetical protein